MVFKINSFQTVRFQPLKYFVHIFLWLSSYMAHILDATMVHTVYTAGLFLIADIYLAQIKHANYHEKTAI